MNKRMLTYLAVLLIFILSFAFVAVIHLSDPSPESRLERVELPEEENIDILSYTVTDVEKDGDHILVLVETDPVMSIGDSFFVPFVRMVKEMNPGVDQVDVEVRVASDEAVDPHYVFTDGELYVDTSFQESDPFQ